MRVCVILPALALLSRASCQCHSPSDNFGLDFLQTALPLSGNFFFSPFSIWSALVLAYFGSRGNTQVELERVLRLTDREETLALFRAFECRYESGSPSENYTLDTANRIYVDQTVGIQGWAFRVLKDKVKTIDFRQTGAADEINQFVDTATRGKIPDIVKSSDLVNAQMVLLNAVYFKGLWKQQFYPASTRKETFYVSPHRRSIVDMMSQTGDFRYGESRDLEAQMLEMPYKGEEISMFVLLPRQRNTGKEIDTLIRKLNDNTLESIIKGLKSQRVQIKFPKFGLETTLQDDLKKTLIQMGITDLFSHTADLTNFAPQGCLYVEEGIHKAVIDVNEEGTEAAAVTALILTKSAVTPRAFTCNRPFLFFIRDNAVKNILFMGIYQEPL